jgi:hypothetical protein
MSPFRSPQPRHQTSAPAINAVRLTPDSDSRAGIGCATKLRKPLRHFDENSAKLQVVGALYAKEFGNLQLLLFRSELDQRVTSHRDGEAG